MTKDEVRKELQVDATMLQGELDHRIPIDPHILLVAALLRIERALDHIEDRLDVLVDRC